VSDQPLVFSRFVFFGTGMYREHDGAPRPYAFGTEEEASRWCRIAAEAVLICVYSYDGFSYDPTYTRFEFDEDLLGRREFGYAR
jgi:hypothetical protein